MRSRPSIFVAGAAAAVALVWLASVSDARRPASFELGRSVAVAGDVDRDGVPDLLVGSCGLAQIGDPDPLAAAALVYSGRDGKLLRRLPASAGDNRGAAVAGVGDLNRDAIPDFAVGTRTAGSGDIDYAGQVEAISGADGSVLWTARGAVESEQFGWSVAAAGDVNGDGVPDVAAGSLSLGVARVLSGRDGKVLFEWKGRGAAQGDDFGRAISGGTDVDRDGRPDILVGAPFEGIGSTHAPPRGPGEITLFSGKDGRVLLNVKGESARGKFGASVAFLPDMNGDGTPDLLVGAPECSPDERRFGGRVYVVSGKDGAVLRRIDGRAAGEALGSSVAAVGDLDADGIPDILAGAPNPGSDGTRDGDGAEWGGRARVFSGKTGALLRTLRAPESVEPYLFGAGVAGLPDVSGDGVPDLLVGAPEAGAVVYAGATGAVLLRLLR